MASNGVVGITPLGSNLWAFSPSRDSEGGSAWLLRTAGARSVLVDVPLLEESHLAFLEQQPAGWILLSHRQGHGRCRRLQERLGWPVVVQEQEAYLLPTVPDRQTFEEHRELEPGLRLLWTPGPTPGSCCLHWAQHDRNVLFSGRLLWPRSDGGVELRQTASTFHGPRQLRSLERLTTWLGDGQPAQIACAAGLGPLHGAKLVERGATALQQALVRAAAINR